MKPTGYCHIDGAWRAGGGGEFSRSDPAAGNTTWTGPAASTADIDAAVAAATRAAGAWAALKTDQRSVFLDAFGRAVAARREELLEIISLETGRPRWEVKTECDALITKIDLTKRAFAERRCDLASTKDGVTSATRFKPLGPLAVLGPFNLPAHLPNGHIVPALLAGNTVVFKPSEMTPAVGEIYARCWADAGLPAGVFNMVQGGREQGAALATHADIRGVLFTGSRAAGVALSKALAPCPEKMLALEMGGNNPLLATRVRDLDAAALTIVQSAFLTAGQRCTCARRLIVLGDPEGDRILERTVHVAAKVRAGAPADVPEPFMGPVISAGAADAMRKSEMELASRGGKALLPLRSFGPLATILSPGIMDVTSASRADEELFGPLLQVIRVPNFDAAIAEANNTRFGLAAALLSDDASLYERFCQRINAGIVNWNRPTNGASSALPFGGVGASGNHRPAGSYSVDYTNDPVASQESPTLAVPASLPPGISL
ncbi:MAG TPA: succinylglutamate-semialdehyde dehydrogenase [Phycisphaerae bacterium]|nr:succinylglutamate-semialdehyde dehydrogenase [Phycisphaerae bacterium]